MEVLLDWFYWGSRISVQFWVGQMERGRNFLLNYKTAPSSPSTPPCAQSCSDVLKRSIKATPTLPYPLRSQGPPPPHPHPTTAFESQCKAVSSLRKDVLTWLGCRMGTFPLSFAEDWAVGQAGDESGKAVWGRKRSPQPPTFCCWNHRVSGKDTGLARVPSWEQPHLSCPAAADLRLRAAQSSAPRPISSPQLQPRPQPQSTTFRFKKYKYLSRR